LIAVWAVMGSVAGAQTRADTLAVFDAVAKGIGMTREPADHWFVKAGDSLTASFAAHRKQPTRPAPSDTIYCSGGSAGPGDIAGSVVSVRLTFESATKASLSVYSQCTMRRGRSWGFVSGDITVLERKNGEWVVTDKLMVIS
jgi:hypothetical protein